MNSSEKDVHFLGCYILNFRLSCGFNNLSYSVKINDLKDKQMIIDRESWREMVQFDEINRANSKTKKRKRNIDEILKIIYDPISTLIDHIRMYLKLNLKNLKFS